MAMVNRFTMLPEDLQGYIYEIAIQSQASAKVQAVVRGFLARRNAEKTKWKYDPPWQRAVSDEELNIGSRVPFPELWSTPIFFFIGEELTRNMVNPIDIINHPVFRMDFNLRQIIKYQFRACVQANETRRLNSAALRDMEGKKAPKAKNECAYVTSTNSKIPGSNEGEMVEVAKIALELFDHQLTLKELNLDTVKAIFDDDVFPCMGRMIKDRYGEAVKLFDTGYFCKFGFSPSISAGDVKWLN